MLKLIVGLGNSGKKFFNTRHNFGFVVLDAWAKAQGANFVFKPEFQAEVSQLTLTSKRQVLVKPQTMMNDSGQVVKKTCQFYWIKPEGILLIHDDSDLLFGQMRFVFGRGSAGHHGVESVIEALATRSFFRLRLGIRPSLVSAEVNLEKFVLQKFDRHETRQLSLIIKKATEIISVAINQEAKTPEELVGYINNLKSKILCPQSYPRASGE